jgi:hypothetical protein
MKNQIRLLAVDIDGTLLDSHFQLSSANREALQAAHQQGIEILLVTGRRYSFARPIAEQLGIELTLVASNGAVIKSLQGETLSRQLLPRQKARAVLAAAGLYRDSALLLFDREGMGQIVVERLDPAFAPVQGYFERNRRYLQQVARLEDALADEDPIQVLFVGPITPMRELAKQLEGLVTADAIAVTRAEYAARDLTLLDVLEVGCSKGTALAAWTKRRGLRREQVMAIGDNWNDREMLAFAGLPVLMANSDPVLLEPGWQLTTSNDKSGVAAAIEKYLLKA